MDYLKEKKEIVRMVVNGGGFDAKEIKLNNAFVKMNNLPDDFPLRISSGDVSLLSSILRIEGKIK